MAASTVQAVPKLYDVILWLLGRVEKFPRSQKFTLGDRTVNHVLDTLELLIEATYTRAGPIGFAPKGKWAIGKTSVSDSALSRFQGALPKTVRLYLQ